MLNAGSRDAFRAEELERPQQVKVNHDLRGAGAAERWYKGTRSSNSGKRLATLIAPGCEVSATRGYPVVGNVRFHPEPLADPAWTSVPPSDTRNLTRRLQAVSLGTRNKPVVPRYETNRMPGSCRWLVYRTGATWIRLHRRQVKPEASKAIAARTSDPFKCMRAGGRLSCRDLHKGDHEDA